MKVFACIRTNTSLVYLVYMLCYITLCLHYIRLDYIRLYYIIYIYFVLPALLKIIYLQDFGSRIFNIYDIYNLYIHNLHVSFG